MLKKTYLALCLVLALSFSSLGCSKLTDDQKEQAQQDTLSSLQSTMQLPVPDDTYSSSSSVSASTVGKENVRYLIDTIINSIGAPFRESNSHFADVVSNGERSTKDGFKITSSFWNAELDMSGDDPSGSIQWTYILSGATYFKATTTNFGLSGNIQATTSSTQLDWRVDLTKDGNVKTITVSRGSVGRLVFTVTPPKKGASSNTVDLTGFVNNGSLSVIAKWDATGGSYTVNGGTQTCWNSSLQNATCPATK